MASVLTRNGVVVFISTFVVHIYKSGSTEKVVVHSTRREAKDGQNQDEEHQDGEHQDGKNTSCSGSRKDGGDGGNGGNGGNERILACTLSASGRFLVYCDGCRNISLWNLKPECHQVSIRTLARKCSSLAVTAAEDVVLVSDKAGDVYSYSVCQPDEAPRLLLGHISMLLDVTLCGKDQFVATCDRDEKIRISCYPNAYSIHSFCLGHQDFVSKLQYIESEDILLSGSGDGSLRLWDYRNGKMLCCVFCSDDLRISPQSEQEQSTTESVSGITDDNDSGQSETVQSNQSNQLNTTESDGMEVESTGEDHTLSSNDEDRESRNRDIDVTQSGKTLDIKSLVYCPKWNLIALVFDRHPVVAIYQLHVEDDKYTVKFVQEISTRSSRSPVWDVSFDDAALLWLLQASDGNTVSVYKWNEAEAQLVELTGNDDVTGVLQTARAVNQNWDFFKDAVDVESMFPMLHKARLDKDNVKDYLSRKHERIQSQKAKRDRHLRQRQQRRRHKKQTGATSGEQKKIKFDTDGSGCGSIARNSLR